MSKKQKLKIRAISLLATNLLVASACNASAGGAPADNGAPAGRTADLLIFQGAATAYGDAESIAAIADSRGWTYDIVSSAELDAMSDDAIASYGTIAWPGGYAGQMSASLDRGTRDRIQRVVHERGVSFVGFCAGAFIAISPDTSWGFALMKQETLPYYHLEDKGVPAAMTPIRMSDGSTRELVWWGGPKLPEVSGPGSGVIGRYTDTQEPAIIQTRVGNGLMILSGPHPEAPADWRGKLGLSDSDGLEGDQELAARLLEAGLRRAPL